jgi:3-hydroxybutyryl-CoA dehydrogenase
VRLFDASEGAAAEAKAFVAAMLDRQVAKGRLDAPSREAALARLSLAAGLQALAGVDAVVEAIVEDLEAKRRLFGELEPIVGDEAVLATNTSSLSVTQIAAACRRPERVAGCHFFNPVPLMKVIEVIPGVRTAAEVCESLADLARQMGHTPVAAADMPGFLVNHAGRGYGTEALRLLQEGVATPPEIDRVMREAAGFPIGPFELQDLTGLDVSDAVMRSIYHQFYEEPRFRPSPVTAQRVAAGLLGRKTGQGWYGYEAGRKVTADEPIEDASPLPGRVWVEGDQTALRDLLQARGAALQAGGTPAADALCLVAPLGRDVTSTALALGLDPTRTAGIDPLLGFAGRLTLMASPLTSAAMRQGARVLLQATGRQVTSIADSPGFITQRILACVVNVACEIAQQRIATPADIDTAVRLGLGYPHGPLAWGDRLGARRLLEILDNLQETTGDPRYRASLWLRRRALLGISLLAPDLAA